MRWYSTTITFVISLVNFFQDESVAFCDTVDNIEAGFDPKSDEELNDERSIHCGIFVPLFKAFGNCTQ